MSDVSVLSHEYKAASDLSHVISDTLIVLKKAYFALPGVSEDDSNSLEERGHQLADILVRLQNLIGDSQIKPIADVPPIPESLVARLRREHGGSLSYYIDDLHRVADRLTSGLPKLQERDLQLLDELASVTDAEASRVFRQMMRR